MNSFAASTMANAVIDANAAHDFEMAAVAGNADDSTAQVALYRKVMTAKANGETIAHYAMELVRRIGWDAAARMYEKDNCPEARKMVRIIRLIGTCAQQKAVMDRINRLYILQMGNDW